MKNNSRKTLALAAALPLALAAQTASAAMITEWGYNVDNVLLDPVSVGTTGPDVSGAGTGTLSWGSGPSSSVSIDENISAPGGLFTNDLSGVAGGTFTHNNQPIPASDRSLVSFNLNSTLTLTALTPAEYAGQTEGPLSINFNSFFTETDNIENGCLSPSTSVCDDIFSLANAEIGDFNNGLFEVYGGNFTIDDYFYEVFLTIDGLIALEDDECDLIGAAPGCIGLRTLEREVNTFATNFRIEANAVSVPEPGTLALLGMGLVGLGFSRRKKH